MYYIANRYNNIYIYYRYQVSPELRVSIHSTRTVEGHFSLETEMTSPSTSARTCNADEGEDIDALLHKYFYLGFEYKLSPY